MAREIERRVVGGDVRLKMPMAVSTSDMPDIDDMPMTLEGYGAVFGQETVIAGLFREQIDPAAFDDVLTNDVRAAVNHDPNWIIGRVANGTLRLATDKIGLRYEIDLNPSDPDAQRIAAKVQRGDVDQSSFSFAVSADGESWDYSETKAGKLPLRRIMHVDELYDLGPVAFAAYPQTSVSARAEARAKEAGDEKAREVAEQAARQARMDVRQRRQRVIEAA